ncbi:hypothetical protein CRM22_009330 [Opisthorchis felineus]|uniref:DUF5641 domain-containing protein n=1 Tax=Opisthorchis felineus TaxID=147828 RepID=A0A4S2LF23_OPIFE|nr:hypothetical protein CRM22_009330 [Opisthorchis felineus]
MQAIVKMSPKVINTQGPLGIEWDPPPDTHCFRLRIPENPLTQRGILSFVCSLFDPLGWVGRVCLPSKHPLQELCKAGLGWGAPISEAHSIRWHSWSKLVRSIGIVRRIIFVLIQEQALSDGCLSTFFVEVKRILNDRPLTSVSSDCRDAFALTPNHLLLHEANAGIPSHCSLKERLTRRWKQVDYLSSVCSNRWLKEYIPTLKLRHKWLCRNKNLRRDDILVVSEHPARGRWPLGIVTECQTDADGLVRTVSLRKSSGVIRRDVRSLCLLEGKTKLIEGYVGFGVFSVYPDRLVLTQRDIVGRRMYR